MLWEDPDRDGSTRGPQGAARQRPSQFNQSSPGPHCPRPGGTMAALGPAGHPSAGRSQDALGHGASWALAPPPAAGPPVTPNSSFSTQFLLRPSDPSSLPRCRWGGYWCSGNGMEKAAAPSPFFGVRMTAMLLLLLLGCWGGGQALLVPPSELKQLSAAGSKVIASEVENAIHGVKRMKALMDRTSKDHQAVLLSLEETKRQKEEAVELARVKEQELAARQEVCNDTMLALWEDCKPCLKSTCLRFYSRTCHSGAGLVGRQLEEFLNHLSPFSIWVNGERIDSLLEREQQQERQFEDLEERFSLVEDGVDDIFQDSSQVYSRMAPFFYSPFGRFREAFRGPPVQRVRLIPRTERFSRELHPFFQHPLRGSFHRLFQPFFEMPQRMLEGGSWEQPPDSFGLEPRNFSDDRMVCREIRRNSAGCLRMRDECDKCRQILSVDCGQTDPSQSQLREQLEDALRLAERFTSRYDDLLRGFQAEMLNTSSLLDQLNRQFGWVSRLANLTRGTDGFLQVTTVLSKAPNPTDPTAPPDTQVTVQLFDSEPLVLTVPGDISWEDPRFMELVAEQALQHYKQNSVE